MAGSGPGPASGGASGARPGGQDVPRAVLRAWDEAEARLFPTVMARPDLYQQSVIMIQRLLGRLRDTCPDVPALLAANERGGDLAAEDPAAVNLTGEDLTPADPAGGTDTGIRLDLVAAAACAMRYRELVASMAARDRLDAVARARADGQSWTVVAETGSEDRAPFVPYQRIEAEVASGRAVIISIEPDETLSRAVRRLDLGQIDLVTGGLQIGEAVGSYLDRDAFEAALRQARGPAGTRPPA
jgi:hypothetical protein